MQVRKQQLEQDMEQQTGSKLGKEYVKAVYCHPTYLNSHAEHLVQNAGLDEAQAGMKSSGRNINNLDVQMTPPFWQKAKNSRAS